MPVDRCPLCGSDRLAPLNRYGPRCLVGDYHVTTGQVENVWCQRCGGGWNRLMMSDAELAAFYAGYTKKTAAADEDDLLFGTSDAEVETLTDSQARFLASHVQEQTGRVLDVGCGKGSFLRAFARLHPDWQCVGIEPSRAEADLARRAGGTEVIEGMFGSVPLETGSFDLIAIMHVLEHVSRPIETLRELHRLLRPGGRAFIEVPNPCDLNMFYDLLLFEHLHHFTPETLAWLAVREGFEVMAHERSTSYGAQRLIARKRPSASGTATWPSLTMGAGFSAWTGLWRQMTEFADRGAAEAAAGRRVAIFGAGMTAATWLVYTALHEAPLLGLFDESPWKIGRTLFDRPIHALSDVRTHAPDVILIATMPNSQRRVAEKLAAACDRSTEIRAFTAVEEAPR
jgi:SAM-dependent methyltransferase